MSFDLHGPMKPFIPACQDGGPLHHPHGLPHKHLELELDQLSIKARAGEHRNQEARLWLQTVRSLFW